MNRPVAVAEVAEVADVAAVMRFANDTGLQVAVQLTGHGAWTYDRPTVLVHTRRLDEITIRAGRARVGAGVLWTELLAAAAPLGLTGLIGSAPDVGVVGYHAGGGIARSPALRLRLRPRPVLRCRDR